MMSCCRKCIARTNKFTRVLLCILLVLLCGLMASCATNPVTGKDELMHT